MLSDVLDIVMDPYFYFKVLFFEAYIHTILYIAPNILIFKVVSHVPRKSCKEGPNWRLL